MSFLKNLHFFLKECRQYDRKVFPKYQWSYIQKTLESHQYMTELLSEFSSTLFDRLYDASFLRYEGVMNHAHNNRYKSHKVNIFKKMKDMVQEKSSSQTPWVMCQDMLKTGQYRAQILAWEEVRADLGLQDYVNFLFDQFEKQEITVAYWVAFLIEWAGHALDKEPFLMALRDSLKAYDQQSSDLVYTNKPYSCMLGLEDRIAH